MEGQCPVGPGVEQPDSHSLADLHLEWHVVVGVAIAVEHHRVGPLGQQLVHVDRLTVGAVVVLGLCEDERRVDRWQVGRIDHDRTEEPVGDVGTHRHRGAVIHPDPGPFRGEAIGQGLSGRDRDHHLVGGALPGMEVDGVAQRALVDEPDDEGVPHPAVQGRPGGGAVVGPHLLGDSRSDLHVLLGDGERVSVDATGLHGRQHRVGDHGVTGGLAPRHLVTGVGVLRVGLRWRGRVGCGDRRSDRLDGHHHSHLPVSDHRAPAVEVAPDHPHVDHRRLPRREPPGVVTGLEHQVVHVGRVGVVDRDHQPIADRDLDV